MNGKSIKRIVAGWMGVMIILAAWPVTRSLAQPNTTIDPVLEAHILSTTVQIKLYAPRAGAQPASGARPFVLAEGLGTLARWRGEASIVTHNHWGSILIDAEFVQIYDARGKLVLELSGAEFRALIRYQDAGSMILTDPQCLASICSPELAELGDSLNVKASDAVLFIHQTSYESLSVELIPARVAALAQYKGLPVFKVLSLEGQPIISGDSGGGVWHDGRLVGNLWGRFSERTGEAGYAAQLIW